MTERIDHAAEARRGLSVLDAPDTILIADALSAAQVHATLALVEQQRIANLIALGIIFNDDSVIVSRHKGEVALEAREALGLS